MITLREYNTEDLVEIDDAVEPFLPKMPMKEFTELTQRGIAITGVEDGDVRACGGIAYFNDNDGVAWLRLSKKCLHHSLQWSRAIRETFKVMRESVGDLVVSTYILKNFCRGQRVARLIGMKKTDESEEFQGNTYIKYTVF